MLAALGEHPDIGFLLVRSAEHGPLAMNSRGVNYLAQRRVVGADPLAPFSPHAAAHLLRSDGFTNVADIMVGSFYDPELEQGCAFEELISFHGGLGGPQTRPFLLYPAELPIPPDEIIGAARVHEVLTGWRRLLQDSASPSRAEQRDPVTPLTP